MDKFFEHLENLRKVAIGMLFFFTTFYLVLLLLNRNDNQEIANNIEKFNDSVVIIKSDNDKQDIAEIKNNLEKQREVVKKIVSENKENQEVSNDKIKENIDLNIKEEIIDNSYQSLEKTDKFNKLGLVEIPKIDLNLSIFKGKPFVNAKNKEDTMLYGAVTNKENQVMGKGNYILASHIVSNSNLLFTSISQLENGDTITLKDSNYSYEYRVYKNFEVSNDETWILNDIKDYSILTLYTCVPDDKEIPDKRTVIRAILTDIREL